MAESGIMKKYKLKIHQANFSEESLVINAKDFPGVKKDDILKIHNCDGDTSNHLFMKVKSLKRETELQKDTISIEHTIANQFNLHAFQSVYVLKVDPMDISLDLLEVTFKDQYISRSDMWRLKRHLVGSCTCINEKVEYCDIRAQVNELWIDSNKVKCGLVTDNTRIVLRSASALVYIFLQMSSEMWDFDDYGQLQFERAVNGFLKDLFTKWRDKCYHEFTLVLFSRTFYNASKIEQFPEEVRDIVQKNYKGDFYIDFYNCVAHHERNEDCTPLLFRLKKIFNDYKDMITIPNCPPGHNSVASEGNFLEAINMSLNVFEKHYIDRNFDRTGQLVLCITPGVGVFDVDRDLTVLTKERMIDNGIGSDLVCLGQQPLHAVPLFKFHQLNRNKAKQPLLHDFNIPHWISHSFYSSNPFLDKGSTGIKYVPRILFPQRKLKTKRKQSLQSRFSDKQTELPSLLAHNFEEFDEEVFSLPHSVCNSSMMQNISSSFHPSYVRRSSSTDFNKKSVGSRVRTISDGWKQHSGSPDDHQFHSRSLSRQTTPLHIPNVLGITRVRKQPLAGIASSIGPDRNLEKYLAIKEDDVSSELKVGSAHSLQTRAHKKKQAPRRALINPFVAMSSTLTPLTSNRRRWVHTYPKGHKVKEVVHLPQQDGELIRTSRLSESSDQYNDEYSSDAEIKSQTRSSGSTVVPKLSQSTVGSVSSSEYSVGSLDYTANTFPKPCVLARVNGADFQKTSTVDWKSLRSPACLPITNDYFPSKQRLHTDYTEQSYTLIPDHEDSQYDGVSEGLLNTDSDQCTGWQAQSSSPVATKEIFLELVNQRLCQGFQLVVSGHWGKRKHYDSASIFGGRKSPSPVGGDVSFTSVDSATSPVYNDTMVLSEHPQRYTLNHGRQYHVILLTDENEISVKIYKPRHLFSTLTIEYKYLLWAVSRDKYRMARVKFSHEQYESYHWSYQDNCVCCVGADSDFKIVDSIKYWRSKFILIPSAINKLKTQKAEIEAAQKAGRKARFDLFEADGFHSEDDGTSNQDYNQILDGMVRFFDYMNKIRRPANSLPLRRQLVMNKKSGISGISASSLPTNIDVSSQRINPASSVSAGSFQLNNSPSPATTPASGRSTPQQLKMHASPPNITSKIHSSNVNAKPVAILSKKTEEGNQMNQELAQLEKNVSQAKEESISQIVLTRDTDWKDISSAMRDKKFDFSFISRQRGLHSDVFISIECVHWCIRNISGIDEISDAVELLEKMRKSKLICHASGYCDHPFKYGYFIYYLTDEKDHNEISDPTSHQYDTIGRGNLRVFESRWLELEVKYCKEEEPVLQIESKLGKKRPKSALSSLLENDSRSRNPSGAIPEMKTVHIPLNNKVKTGRTEWCQVQYQSSIKPWQKSTVFSFNVQWMVATATCLFEMLQSWLREVKRCNLCMLPMPNNPFAFPHTEKDASPLHCPLFVPLNLISLVGDVSEFEELLTKGLECRKRIIQFMEKIAIRFGFVRYFAGRDPEAERSNSANSRHYVHYTGQVFLEIPVTDDFQVQGRSLAAKHYIIRGVKTPMSPSHETKLQSHLISPRRGKKSGFDITPGLNDESPPKPSVASSNPEENPTVDLKSCGFYFSANHMLTRRWRMAAFDDCPASKLESDFIKYCATINDHRLVDFYKSIYL
ncbi:GATOR1 complex protein DEPDC5-like [Styela clava]